MSSTPSASTDDHRKRLGVLTAALVLTAFAVYALTITRTLWTTDVYGANWTSWHLATAGSPWIDGAHIPDVGPRSSHLLAVVQTANGHTAFGRFPGVVVAGLPAYLIASGPMSTVPGSLTAALLTACALGLLFNALRRRMPDTHALLATAAFGFATPVWTVSANLMWPHTITVLGITGMAWAASADRWSWVGVFGGIALWGRLHAALIVAILALGVGIRRRDARLVARAATTSVLFLVGECAWDRWMYGSWSPLGGYGGVSESANNYRWDLTNYLGMWVAPDRGILVWTPVVALLVPALLRSWRTIPDWSRSLLIAGVVYTVVQSAIIGFAGGTGFYGYRYGLEFLACATPALAFAAPRMGRVARVLVGPLLAVQALAFLLGAMYKNLYTPQGKAWHQNTFVHTVDKVGLVGWAVTAIVAALGLLAARRLSRSPGATVSEPHEPKRSAV
ncbi:MAG TPA: hypothetical protein VHR35_14555 [Nocardioides sp.]|jgi:alpha-1,2-mannosyltransferase|nr:hypothetical protein [Nocardioides sp.]